MNQAPHRMTAASVVRTCIFLFAGVAIFERGALHSIAWLYPTVLIVWLGLDVFKLWLARNDAFLQRFDPSQPASHREQLHYRRARRIARLRNIGELAAYTMFISAANLSNGGAAAAIALILSTSDAIVAIRRGRGFLGSYGYAGLFFCAAIYYGIAAASQRADLIGAVLLVLLGGGTALVARASERRTTAERS